MEDLSPLQTKKVQKNMRQTRQAKFRKENFVESSRQSLSFHSGGATNRILPTSANFNSSPNVAAVKSSDTQYYSPRGIYSLPAATSPYRMFTQFKIPRRMLYLEVWKTLKLSSGLSIMQVGASTVQWKSLKKWFSPAKTLLVPSLTPPPLEQTLAAQTALNGGVCEKVKDIWEV